MTPSDVSHDPQQLRNALVGLDPDQPVYFDTETTGLIPYRSRVLSYGFRVGQKNFILFTEYCSHSSFYPYRLPTAVIQQAISPLAETKRIIVGHNIKFDIAMSRFNGITISGELHDTMTILRLLDQDRGNEKGQKARWNLVCPILECKRLDYKLKHVVTHLCRIKPVFTPDVEMQHVDYKKHVEYLRSDLLVTDALYQYERSELTPELYKYVREVLAPLADILVDIRFYGIAADRSMIDQLLSHLWKAYELYEQSFVDLVGFDMPRKKLEIAALLYDQWGYRNRWRKVDGDTLQQLLSAAKTGSKTRLIALHYLTQRQSVYSLITRLQSYCEWLVDGRIHSSFDNRQATGRISSSDPNVQQLAKPRIVMGQEVRSRDILMASPGYKLVAADIEQADVRVLAHMIDSCKVSTSQLKESLLEHRRSGPYWHMLEECRNHKWSSQNAVSPVSFYPHLRQRMHLVRMFKNSTGDFYTQVAQALGGTQSRKIWKTILLAQINGQAPRSLAGELKVSLEQAKDYVAKFLGQFPDIAGWKELAKMELAHTGRTRIWSGRYRQVTAHRWLVHEQRVQALLSYASRHRYVYDFSPIKPSIRTITGYVHRIWNVTDQDDQRLIYADGKQLALNQPHVFDCHLQYHLPVRNIPFSNIRKVWKLNGKAERIEEAKYDGFDSTSRVAINAIMQGGTVDVAIQMMLRARDTQAKYGAKLINQIHDELVWEVPEDKLLPFADELRDVLQQAPSPDWTIPIVVSMKTGDRFGSMVELKPSHERTGVHA